MYYVRRCAHYFRPYLWRILFSVLSMGVVAGCTAAAAYLVKPVLDEIFINKNRDALMLIPLLIIGLYAVKGVSQFLQTYLMRYCAIRVLEQLRNDLYAKMVRLPLSFFEQSRIGMLMSRIVNDVNLLRSSIPQIVQLIRQVFTMLGLIAVAFYRDPYLATWALVVLPLTMYPLVHFGSRLRRVGRKNQEKIADISTLLQETFSGIQQVKASATEDKEERSFIGHNAKLVRFGLKGAFYSALSNPVMEFIGGLGVSLVIWYGGNQVIAGESTPGNFFSFLTALMMLYEPIKQISRANMTIQRALAGAERVFDMLDSREISEESGGSVELTPPFRELTYEGVWFGYEDASDWALRDIHLSIRSGERFAVVGPSGAGKSSLVQLTPGFYAPQFGEIRINGCPVREYTLGSLRRFMGIVTQETILFNTSIRNNICYGIQHHVEDAQLEEVCRVAYIHEHILQLPQGYDTIIGERGVKLSGGQKQRLAIARALLKDPPLLILDEATSALDTESERIVQKALENLMRERTSIVIAHRLSTVLHADRIAVMDQGRIVDIGTHSELLNRCGLYHKLYQMQFEDNPLAL
jgi:subfamily B ATP-binding cassette protein MsbA